MVLSKKQLKQVLEELYAIDPTLKQQESRLAEIINDIIKLKPETRLDEKFFKRLRTQILTETGAASQANEVLIANHMNKFIYSMYGAVVVIMMMTVSMSILLRPVPGKQPVTLGKQSSFEQRLTKVAAGAFGSLKGSQAPAFGKGGGGGGGSSIATSEAPVARDSKFMPPIEQTVYSFKYAGEEIKLPTEGLSVYKRLKPIEASVDTQSLLSELNVGFVDLNSFGNQNLQNINLVQREDYGYVTSVGLDEGFISIYQNWEKWPAGKCGADIKCSENLRVKLSDIPEDAELLSVANAFAAEHNIDLSNFGEPWVNSEWRRMYEAAPVKDNYYFPDGIEVVYPFRIDGKETYEEYNGFKTGLSISVNPKERKVAYVNNLLTQNFEASDYELETDTKKLVSLAEKGGIGGMVYYVAPNSKKEVLDLDTPTVVLTRVFIYRNNQNTELFIPALSFPIKNVPKDQSFYRRSVVIPLVKEILAERESTANPGSPIPLDTKAK